MIKATELVGLTFGRLTAIERVGDLNGRPAYLCQCECGNKKVVRSVDIMYGKTRSCGCLRNELSAERNKRTKTKPNATKRHPLFYRWTSMRQRCNNPNNPSYHNYGGRGIKVCDKWESSFNAFVQDMGMPPDKSYTLDRIDNDGDYTPENCRWASPKQQLVNQRRSIRITISGKTMHAMEWSDKHGVSYQMITRKFRDGGIELATQYIKDNL